jgi:hypothetical protein
VETVEKLVRNLVKDKIVSFAGKHRLCRRLRVKRSLGLYEC